MKIEDVVKLSPLVLGLLGGITGTVIALAAIFSPNLSTDKFWGAMTFATGLIGVSYGSAAGSNVPSIPGMLHRPQTQIDQINNATISQQPDDSQIK